MYPISTIRFKTCPTDLSTLEIVGDILTLAKADKSEFHAQVVRWIGRRVLLCQPNTDACHLLARIASNGQLKKTGCSKDELIASLEGIRANCKLYTPDAESTEETALKAIISNVKQALDLLASVDEKLPVGIQTAYCHELVSLVNPDEAIIEQLNGHVSSDGMLQFDAAVEEQITDRAFKQFLQLNREKVKDVKRFDFSRHKKLSFLAPEMVLKACPAIEADCFKAVFAESRFMDWTLVVPKTDSDSEMRMGVNRGVLAHHATYFAALFQNDSSRDEPGTTVLQDVPDAHMMPFFIECHTGTPTFGLENALRMLRLAHNLGCQMMIEQARGSFEIELKDPLLQMSYSHKNYKELGEIHSLFQECRFHLGELAKTFEQLLSDCLEEKLKEGATTFVKELGAEFSGTQAQELRCYYVLQELKKMDGVPHFPYPKRISPLVDSKELEEQAATGGFPIHLHALLRAAKERTSEEEKEEYVRICQLIEKIESLSFQEQASTPFTPSRQEAVSKHAALLSSLEQADDPDAIALQMMENLQEMRSRQFKDGVMQNVLALQLALDDEQSMSLFFAFAHEETKTMIEKKRALPRNFCGHLGLKEYIEKKGDLSPKCYAMLSNFLHTLEEHIKDDALIPYLLGKINQTKDPEQARRYFRKALAIDQNYAEAKEALEKTPRTDLFDDRFDYLHFEHRYGLAHPNIMRHLRNFDLYR